jgi:hypothetical protein
MPSIRLRLNGVNNVNLSAEIDILVAATSLKQEQPHAEEAQEVTGIAMVDRKLWEVGYVTKNTDCLRYAMEIGGLEDQSLWAICNSFESLQPPGLSICGIVIGENDGMFIRVSTSSK